MSTYGNKIFGLRDVKVTNIVGTTQKDLPVAQKLKITPKMKSGELEGDDSLVSVVAFIVSAEWELEAGGIDLDALAIITGKAVTVAGTTPNATSTWKLSAGDNMPYFNIYGKSMGDGLDDIHAKLSKCKCTELEGEFSEGEFFVTSCKGIAVDDGTNGVMTVVQNETAANLPAT